MRISKKNLALAFLSCCLSLSLSACGGGGSSEEKDNQSPAAHNTSPQNTQPNIGTNAPLPESKNSSSQEIAELFFENKRSYDGFSDSLKERVDESYRSEPAVAPGGTVYNTLFGPAVPVTPVFAEDSSVEGCDPTGSFLCLDAPEENFGTPLAGLDVIAKINLNQLAVFSATDPVAVVSVFNNSTGGSASEIPVMPADVQSTSNPDVGKFSTAVGLGGPGRYTVLVSAYRVDSTGGNELVSLFRTGSRLEAPRTEFVEARPSPVNFLAEPAKRRDPVGNGAVIASQALDVKIKLLTAGGNGVQTRYENYEENGELRSTVVSAPQENGDVVGRVQLHQGLNKIKIISRAPALDAQLGDNAPAPAVLEFTVFNAWGGPRLKMIEPTASGIIPQTAEIQKVELRFCYTFVPSRTQGSAGGATPTLGDDCVAGSLGFTPVLTVNGRQIGAEGDPRADTLDFNASTGIFTAQVTPDFGVNLYQITAADVIAADQPVDSKGISLNSGSFVFGVPMPVLKEGKVNQISDFPEFTNFTKRGLQLDVDPTLLEGDVKEMLTKFLNRPEMADLLMNTFKSTANKPGYVCQDYIDPNTGQPAQSNGDTTVDFLKDTFSLGKIEVVNFKTASHGMLELGLKIHGMHGEANLRAAENEGGNTLNGNDVGFLPVTFSMAEIEANVGVTFPKKGDIDLNNDGVKEERSVLDLRQIPGKPLLKIKGDGPLGRPIYVNSARNPLAAGLELLDWQQGLLLSQFNTILGGTLLCGAESGLNNEKSGPFGMALTDLEKLTGYNKNMFRLPLGLDIPFLHKTLNLDVAYNLLKGDIKFDSFGAHVHNVPLRFNPGPAVLARLTADPALATGEIGAVSRWKALTEPHPQSSFTSERGNASVQIGEDGLNQAFFGAVLSGLLDLNVDANFYADAGITPVDRLTPSGKDLAPGMDANQDGLIDKADELTPVSLEVRPNRFVPPTFSFLTREEVAAFVRDEEEFNSSGGAPNPDVQTYFKEDGQYLRVALADVEISAYAHQPVSEGQDGVGKYCKVHWEDDPSIGGKGFCSLAGDAFVDSKLHPELCQGKELISIPRRNGDKIPAPLYKIKLGVVLHAKITGVDREISAKEKLINPAALEKTILHLQFAPAVVSKKALLLSVEVVENNTGGSNAQVAGIFDTIVRGGFGDRCFGLNELRIPFPGSLKGSIPEGGTQPQDLLPAFGVESIDLGGDSGNPPSVFIDDSHLYLDVLLFAGLNFDEDAMDAEDSGQSMMGGFR